MSVGNNIRYYRKLNNMSQKDLGKILKVSDKTISSWEINRTEPNMDVINDICKIFNCSPNDLTIEIDETKIPKYSSDQAEVLMRYSKLNDEQKQTILNLLRSFT